MVPDFPLNFATYFYRGEFRDLLFCYLVDRVDKGLQTFTLVDSNTKGKEERKWPNLIVATSWNELTNVVIDWQYSDTRMSRPLRSMPTWAMRPSDRALTALRWSQRGNLSALSSQRERSNYCVGRAFMHSPYVSKMVCFHNSIPKLEFRWKQSDLREYTGY